MQVQITVSAGKITDVTALRVPDGNHRDQEINDYAVPILRQQALAAQSAQIDTVSGATVTSDGYRESLQSAIDATHLK
ncbi:FMN-binding protein [Micromonospora sp. IBHARD004]|uniref:FMN-binding protein n=1 Tax=Micromonospora sp. IBHARD004 TaxID=3457764 RepID=UPI004057CDC3